MALDLNVAFEAQDRTIRATLAEQLARTNYGAKSGPLMTEVDVDDVLVNYNFLIEQFGLRKLTENLPKKSILKKGLTIGSDEYVDNVTIPLRKLSTKHGNEYVVQARSMMRQIPRFIDAKIAAMIASGGAAFTENSFDGVPYFSKLHPRFSAGGVQVNHDDAGGGSGYWYLFDTSILAPVIWQWLKRPAMEDFGPDSERARREREVAWDLHLDAGWGMGLWYYGYASNKPLNEANLNTAIEAMRAIKTDAKTDGEEQFMGIEPNLLVVGRANALTGRKIIRQTSLANGETNIMQGSMQLLEFGMLA